MIAGIDVSHDRDAVGDREDLFQAMRDVDDRQAVVAEAAEDGEEAFRLGGV